MYTPPDDDAVDFDFSGSYIPPADDDSIDFDMAISDDGVGRRRFFIGAS